MKKEDLKKLTEQIKRYNLEGAFRTIKEFEEWLNELTSKQINNLNSLNIDPNTIPFSKNLLCNLDLLNCNDYLTRVKLMCKIKNINSLCESHFVRQEFLKSKNYYDDMQLMIKVFSTYELNDTPEMKNAAESLNGLLIDTATHYFSLKSKYHKQDVIYVANAILKAKEEALEKNALPVRNVAGALYHLAGDNFSLKSNYHEKDMEIVSKMEVKYIDKDTSNTEIAVSLGTNEVSLADKYHTENMEIIAKCPDSIASLYELMTTKEVIRNNNYRTFVNKIANTNDKLTAAAMYFYIIRVLEERNSLVKQYGRVCQTHYPDAGSIGNDMLRLGYGMGKTWNIIKSNHPEFINNLELLSKVEGPAAIYLGALLCNNDFTESKYKLQDIEILKAEKDLHKLQTLFKVMRNEESLKSEHHVEDLKTISRCHDNKFLDILCATAIDKDNLNSPNHEFDMNFIANLRINDEDFIDECKRNGMVVRKTSVNKAIKYYILSDGINDPKHIEQLEASLKGEKLEKVDIVNYLESLANDPEKLDKIASGKGKGLSKVRNVFKK